MRLPQACPRRVVGENRAHAASWSQRAKGPNPEGGLREGR